MRRGFDLSSTLVSRVLRLPESAGLVCNFHFGKILRKSVEAVVVLADAENPQTCAFRGVTEYISAALAIGWDLTAGYLFPMLECNGERKSVAITVPRMTAALQAHLRAGELPDRSRCTQSRRVAQQVARRYGGRRDNEDRRSEDRARRAVIRWSDYQHGGEFKGERETRCGFSACAEKIVVREPWTFLCPKLFRTILQP